MAILAFCGLNTGETFRKLMALPMPMWWWQAMLKITYLWFVGLVEKDKDLQRRKGRIFYISGFMIGVWWYPHGFSPIWEHALAILLLPLHVGIFNYGMKKILGSLSFKWFNRIQTCDRSLRGNTLSNWAMEPKTKPFYSNLKKETGMSKSKESLTKHPVLLY